VKEKKLIMLKSPYQNHLKLNNMAKNKTEQELRAELEQKKVQDFLKEYEEAYEKHITPINIKYSLRLIPTITHNKVGGMNPAYGLETYKREEVTPQDPVNENSLETETK
jgi:hypothetical protein